MSELANRINTLPKSFWLVNSIQMLEKMAYWAVLIQMPVYIAQKDEPGGLLWEQSTKGIIFFAWALMQNLTPVFSGGLSDKYGRRKLLYISFLLIIAGYVILGTQREFWPFVSGALILGLGSGLFKPIIQGAIAGMTDERNSSAAWGIQVMLINLAVFASPFLSVLFKELSWDLLFFGSAAIFSINFVLVQFFKPGESESFAYSLVQETFKGILNPRVLLFVLPMSGFIIIYMQFYETLPNYINDWGDTDGIVKYLGLGSFFTKTTVAGTGLKYEFFYTLNSILIIVFVTFIAWLTRKHNKISVIIAGNALIVAGILLCGTAWELVLVIGVLVYTFGEMTINPKFSEFMAELAPKGKKSMYMGYLGISFAIGLGAGSLSGGWLYGELSEKESLAQIHIAANKIQAPHGTSLDYWSSLSGEGKIAETNGITYSEARAMLWKEYNPWLFWVVYAVIGLLSCAGLLYYKRRYT